MTYLGSKTSAGVAQAIVSQMPPHDCYIEAFAGTLAVLRAKPPAARSIAIEIDGQTISEFPPPPQVELIEGDALEHLARFNYAGAGRVLVYADPPYPLATRSSRHRYRHEFTDQHHAQLLHLLATIPAAVMISTYPNKLYDRHLADWRSITFQSSTRGGPRTEQLFMNFEDGGKHWHTFAGRNNTDRQRIQRKAKRWKRMYSEMPPGERLAVLAALLEYHSEAV